MNGARLPILDFLNQSPNFDQLPSAILWLISSEGLTALAAPGAGIPRRIKTPKRAEKGIPRATRAGPFTAVGAKR